MGLYGNLKLNLEEKSQDFLEKTTDACRCRSTHFPNSLGQQKIDMEDSLEGNKLLTNQPPTFRQSDYLYNQPSALDSAEYYFQRGVETAKQGERDRFFNILNHSLLALVTAKRGRWVEALSMGKKALQDARSQGGMIAPLCEMILSAVFMEIGDHREVKKRLEISAALLREINPHILENGVALQVISSVKRKQFRSKQEAGGQEETNSSLFRVQMFGPIRIFYREQELDAASWRTVKTRDLLAYLAHQDKPVSSDQILEALWPDLDPDKASALLHTTLYYLRRLLQQFTDEEIIIRGSKRYQLRPGSIITDQRQFKETAHLALEKTMTKTLANELEAAISLYRGDYLEDLDYQWVIPVQEELRNLYIELKQKLAVYYLQNKMYTRAITHLRQLTRLNPYSEDVLRLLLTALIERGDQSAAEQQYAAFSQTISEELGLQPSPEIRAFYKKICDTNQSKNLSPHPYRQCAPSLGRWG